MFEHKKINTLNDFFIELHKRPEEGIYFYRLNGYSNEIKTFIQNYYESARKAGVVIEGKFQIRMKKIWHIIMKSWEWIFR